MNNPYTPLSRAKDGVEMQGVEWPFPAVARYNSNPVASSVVTFTDNTTTVEIGAIGGGGLLIKWIPTTDTTASVTTANFDDFIPSNATRRYAIPVEKAGVPSIVGANKQNGLYNRVAWISATANPSSVVAMEYA